MLQNESLAVIIKMTLVYLHIQYLTVEGTNFYHVVFSQDEDEEVDDFEFEHLYDFQNGCQVTAIAWSPETSLLSLPKQLR